MATSAFKSTTKRSPIGTAASNADDAGSSNRNATHHRRSRSLSRFSGRSHALDLDELPPAAAAAAAKARFVNADRGSGFPETIISLDDLAKDFFSPHLNLKDEDRGLDVLRGSERGRPRSSSARRASAIGGTCSSATATTTSCMKGSSHSQDSRRGRSVSRQHARPGDAANASASTAKPLSDSKSSSRRRRSLSVACYQFSDSEGDVDPSHVSSNHAKLKNFTCGNHKRTSSHKPTAPDQCLKRSLSQKDLSKLYDGYSSHSSALTDDEAWSACSSKKGSERRIKTVYAQKKIDHSYGDGERTALYEAMPEDLRHKAMMKGRPSVFADGDCLQSNNSDVLQAVAMIRKNYTSKLEQSEKRKQDLLAEIMVEEQRGCEISKIVRELLPDPEKAAITEKPSRPRKKSNDRSRMSKCLNEEAEKYFEDFISNVEDTDISSFDGERSDASSTLGGATRPKDIMICCGETETFGFSTGSSLPVEMDGVLLPWLRWDASSDHSPLLCKSKEKATTVQNNVHDAPLEVGRGFALPRSCLSHSAVSGPSGSWFDREEYLPDSEDLLIECWRLRQRINSGGLILCSRTYL
ncbi:uncharacterized protein LOC122058625 isoform X2 [Macadamia integrifolia]|uniref:uncharacterized protein LOC122058625 isoform X2 n=1 Tax=Macadamia integrifolia TaxID=60698 RepID=UPI001C533BC9|nr:uncharacterized protein LOC122058625 isoform X2 [Macadamia integrifolia]